MTDIDKQALYGDYRDRQKWQDKLYKRAAHKALDLPEDDMNINVRKSGIGPWGVAGIALAAAAGPVALAAAMLMKQAAPSVVPPKVVKEVERWGSKVGIEVIPPGEQP